MQERGQPCTRTWRTRIMARRAKTHPGGGNADNLRELAGAVGDLGTLVPFVVGYITINKMDPVGVLVAFGLCKIMAGLYCKTPIPIQQGHWDGGRQSCGHAHGRGDLGPRPLFRPLLVAHGTYGGGDLDCEDHQSPRRPRAHPQPGAGVHHRGGGQKYPFQDSNVTAIMLVAPCRLCPLKMTYGRSKHAQDTMLSVR